MASCVAAWGCSTTAQTDSFSDPNSDGANSGALTGSGGTGGDSGRGSSDSGAGETSGGSDGGSSGDEPAPGLDAPTCPDPLPPQWVFCEDFEQLSDPTDVFFEYQDADAAFVLVDDHGASGTHSMRATYREGKQSAGWLSVAFGRNPIVSEGTARPLYDADGDFDEIYWRLRVKMEAGWPDVGPHKLTRATAFAHADWGQAMAAHLWSNGDDVTLVGDPATCVTEGLVQCSGYNDANGLEFLPILEGTTPLFSKGMSGQWHCVEGHVRLNTPGAVDGVFEFWIDDNLEASTETIDWRGTWDDYGINLVSIENYWNEGAPMELQRWIDDIVISTEPIGCE